jgi:hypothetical protein
MSTWRRHAVVPLMLLAVAIPVLARPALADLREIAVGGIWITLIDHDAAGYTSFERAIEVRRRITEVLSTPKFREGTIVSVQSMGKGAVVMVGGLLVFTVTPQDATGTWMTPVDVAHQWARLLAEGLSRALPDSSFHVF